VLLFVLVTCKTWAWSACETGRT